MLSLPVLEKFTEATESRYERLKKFQALHSDEISLDELIMLEMHMTGIQIPEPLNTILKNHNHDMRPNAGDVNLRFLRSIKNCLGESLRAEIPTIVRDASPYLWDGTDVFIWEVHTRTWKPLYYYPELVIRGPVEQSYFYERTVTSHGQRILNLNENNGGCIVNCPLCPKSAIAKGYLPSSQINSAHNLREILTYQGLQDLSEIDEVAVVTNAFDGEKEALKYLKMLITQLHTLNFQGTLVWYGFNLRSERGIADLAQSCQKNGLSLRFIYTIETFSRPFNAGPKRITIGEVQEILKHAQQYSNQVLFSYIVGLDDLSTMEKYMNHFISFGTSPILSDFFLADWDKANKVLKGEARDLSYYVQARRIIRAAIEKYMPSEQI